MVGATMPRRVSTLLLALLLFTGGARADVRYQTEIVGIEDKALLDQLKSISQLVTLEERLPASNAALRRRCEDDLARLKQALESEGYWAPKLDLQIDSAADPAKVTVSIDAGPRYTLETVTFVAPDGGGPPALDRIHPIAFGLELGKPARAPPIVATEPRIAAELARHGYPYAKVTDRKVVVDHGTHTMSVTYTVDAGPLARFGAHRIEGLTRLDPAYVERRIKWRDGARYDGSRVEETRKALIDSALFAAVRITPAKEPDADGTVKMTIELTERLPRSIGAGVNYNTSEGFGVRAFWEHRNLFDGGEKLRISTDLAEQQLTLNATLRVPDFLAVEQDFLVSADLGEENPDAYDSKRLRLFSGIERRFDRTLAGTGGLSFEKGFVTNAQGSQNYTLAGIPLTMRRDTTDDLLNPTLGTRQSFAITPYQSVGGSKDLGFVSTRVGGSLYRALDDASRYVAAGYGAIGTIFGEGRDDIPADKRLYVGGGGSLRGYGYQRAGPLSADNRPLGGRSSLELGSELRIRITETIGIVPFLEAGNAYTGVWPGGKLLFGTGIGARYYTTVGPVRLDLAFPLEKRSGDDAFQLYVSLGQAF
jgi:translocation and assembly module TamA